LATGDLAVERLLSDLILRASLAQILILRLKKTAKSEQKRANHQIIWLGEKISSKFSL
jgi:hypothetical protein